MKEQATLRFRSHTSKEHMATVPFRGLTGARNVEAHNPLKIRNGPGMIAGPVVNTPLDLDYDLKATCILTGNCICQSDAVSGFRKLRGRFTGVQQKFVDQELVPTSQEIVPTSHIVLSRVENSDMTRLHLQVGAEIPGVEADFPLTIHISQLGPRSRVQAASTSPNREADTTRFMHSVTDQIMANERAQRHLDINAYTGDFFAMAHWNLRHGWSNCAQGINVTAQVSVRVSDTEGFLDPAVKALAEAGPPLLKLHSSPDLATRPYFTQVIKMFTQKDFMEGEYSFDLMQEQCALLASIAKRFFFEPHPSHSCSKAEHNKMDRCLKQEQVTDLVRSYGLPYLKNPNMLSSQKYAFIVSACRVKEPPSPVFDVKWGPWKKGAPTSAQFVVQPGMSAQEKAGRVKLWERFGLGIFSTEVERHRRVRDRAWVLWANFLGQKEDSPVAQKAWSMGTADR